MDLKNLFFSPASCISDLSHHHGLFNETKMREEAGAHTERSCWLILWPLATSFDLCAPQPLFSEMRAGRVSSQPFRALIIGGKSRKAPATPGDRYRLAPTRGPVTVSTLMPWVSAPPPRRGGRRHFGARARPGPEELREREGPSRRSRPGRPLLRCLPRGSTRSGSASPRQGLLRGGGLWLAAHLAGARPRGAGLCGWLRAGAARGAGTRVPMTLVYYQPSAARGILGAVVLSRLSGQAAAAPKTTAPRLPLSEPAVALANRALSGGDWCAARCNPLRRRVKTCPPSGRIPDRQARQPIRSGCGLSNVVFDHSATEHRQARAGLRCGRRRGRGEPRGIW